MEKTKYRTEIAAIGENRWSNNEIEYDTIGEAQTWLNGLANRWFGYDLSRIVPVDTPKNEPVKPTDEFYQKFRVNI